MTRPTGYAHAALAANDGLFTPEAFTEATGAFTEILAQLENQGEVAENTAVPAGQADAEALYVSNAGFTPLFGGSTPQMLYFPEGPGGRARPAEVAVDQVVLGSFGENLDFIALRDGAKSIQVDSVTTGHNPYKVAQRVEQALGERRGGVHHLISRRGDIYSFVPWNRTVDSSSLAATSRGLQLPDRAVFIELESWTNALKVPYATGDDFKVLALEPYTPAQYTALAFVLKKLGIWANADLSAPLGYVPATVRRYAGNANGHTPGVFTRAALGAAKTPGAEFDLPITWQTGQRAPSHLNGALLEQRIALHFPGTPAGTPLSAFSAIKTIYDNAIPNFSFQTELFTQRSTPVFEAGTTAASGAGAAAQNASNARGSGFERSAVLQNQTRTGMYSAAAIANDAIVRETLAFSGRQAQQNESTPSVPVLHRALAFDYSTGAWVVAESRVIRGVYTPPAPRTTPST